MEIKQIIIVVGPTLTQLFKDINACFGGAVQLTTQITPGSNKINIICINEPDAKKTIKPAKFSPLKGDGITRSSKISCNPPSADAYAVAAGTQELPQTNVVEAISDDKGQASGDSAANDRAVLAEQIRLIRNKTMAFCNFNAEQITSLKAIQTDYVGSQTVGESVDSLPTDLTQWPLKLDITLDGIYGFEFGNLITSTYLPNQYQGTGLKPVFSVTKITHKIQGNDWETSLDSVCTLARVS